MSNTRTVSFRVPLSDYAVLLNEAKVSKLSLSELIISKLFSQTDLSEKLNTLRPKMAALAEKLNLCKLEISNLKSENSNLVIMLDESEDECRSLKDSVDNKEIDLNEIRKKLSEAYEDLKIVNIECERLKEQCEMLEVMKEEHFKSYEEEFNRRLDLEKMIDSKKKAGSQNRASRKKAI